MSFGIKIVRDILKCEKIVSIILVIQMALCICLYFVLIGTFHGVSNNAEFEKTDKYVLNSKSELENVVCSIKSNKIIEKVQIKIEKDEFSFITYIPKLSIPTSNMLQQINDNNLSDEQCICGNLTELKVNDFIGIKDNKILCIGKTDYVDEEIIVTLNTLYQLMDSNSHSEIICKYKNKSEDSEIKDLRNEIRKKNKNMEIISIGNRKQNILSYLTETSDVILLISLLSINFVFTIFFLFSQQAKFFGIIKACGGNYILILQVIGLFLLTVLCISYFFASITIVTWNILASGSLFEINESLNYLFKGFIVFVFINLIIMVNVSIYLFKIVLPDFKKRKM